MRRGTLELHLHVRCCSLTLQHIFGFLGTAETGCELSIDETAGTFRVIYYELCL